MNDTRSVLMARREKIPHSWWNTDICVPAETDCADFLQRVEPIQSQKVSSDEYIQIIPYVVLAKRLSWTDPQRPWKMTSVVLHAREHADSYFNNKRGIGFVIQPSIETIFQHIINARTYQGVYMDILTAGFAHLTPWYFPGSAFKFMGTVYTGSRGKLEAIMPIHVVSDPETCPAFHETIITPTYTSLQQLSTRQNISALEPVAVRVINELLYKDKVAKYGISEL